MSNNKTKQLPERFELGIIDRLDSRTQLATQLKQRRQQVLEMIDSPTPIVEKMVEYFVFLEAIIDNLGIEIVNNPTSRKEKTSKWTQSLNTFWGVARMLGLLEGSDKPLARTPWISNGDLEDK